MVCAQRYSQTCLNAAPPLGMFIPLCLVLGASAVCTETDSYSEYCFRQDESTPICHNGACISCLTLSINAPHWNTGTQECDSCDELHYYVQSNECLESCPQSAPLSVNHICRTCYEVSWRKPYWTGSKCDYCYDSYWDGEKCVAECPSTAPKVYAGVCYSCSNSLYFNPENRQCVSRCPDTLPAINADKVCATCFEVTPNTPIWGLSYGYGSKKETCNSCYGFCSSGEPC